ncbi:DUF2066 domain-containing protein [Tepidamorphus sp. 3E244]|uniref:DUF2066 domain-containing protein n=1 Tax=Tepidamorphus sp. 3E244 TaxID=3385498 RepID=UPI0038FD1ED6
MRALNRFQAAASAAILLALCVGRADEARAQSRDAFTVSDIRIEQSAENAVAAKQQAMDAAYTIGLKRLFARLARSKDLGKLPVPSRPRAEALMASFGVQSEVAHGTRYSLTASLRFDEAAIRNVFAASGVQIHARRGPNILIIPVLAGEGGVAAYAEAGAWNEALAAVVRDAWLVDLSLAEGTRRDRVESVDRLVELDRISLGYLRVRYDTQGAVVAQFTAATGEEPASLRIGGDSGAGWFERTIPLADDITDKMAYAAEKVPEILDDTWKDGQSSGPMGGVRINGIPMSGTTVAPQPFVQVALPATAASQLRLEPVSASSGTQAKQQTATQVAVAPVASGLPDGDGSLVLEFGGDFEVGPLGATLARLRPVTAFQFADGDSVHHVKVWYVRSPGALFAALGQEGLSVTRNLASNNWRLSRR